MIPKVKEATLAGGYKVWLRFSDGKVGVIDLSDELWGPLFEPLKDPDRFREMLVDPDLETICWPNGADFAPEFLYAHTVSTRRLG